MFVEIERVKAEAGQFGQVISSAGRLTLTWPPFLYNSIGWRGMKRKKKVLTMMTAAACCIPLCVRVCVFTLFNRYTLPAGPSVSALYWGRHDGTAYLTVAYYNIYSAVVQITICTTCVLVKRYLPTSECSVCSVTRLSTQHDPTLVHVIRSLTARSIGFRHPESVNCKTLFIIVGRAGNVTDVHICSRLQIINFIKPLE